MERIERRPLQRDDSGGGGSGSLRPGKVFSEPDAPEKLMGGEELVSNLGSPAPFGVLADSAGSLPELKDDPKSKGMRRLKIEAVYRTIAEALPLEGRDYRVNMSFRLDPAKGDEVMELKLEGMTGIGRQFASYVVDFIKTNGLVK